MNDDLDHFVASLGSDAAAYTPEELGRLRVEIKKVAQALLRWHRSQPGESPLHPQVDLDESGTNRTLK